MLNSLRGKRVPGPTKKGCSEKKNISQSIFNAACGLKQTVVAVKTYNIATMALYTILSIAVQTDC